MDSSSAESSGELSQDEFQDEVIPSPPRTPTTEEIIEKQTELIVKTPNDPIPYLRRATAYHQRRPPNLRRAYSDACHAVRLATLGSHRDGAIAAEAQMRRAITLHSIGRTAEAFGLLRSVATDQRMKDELEVVNKWRYFMYWHDLIRDAIKAREADGDEIGPWDEVEVPLLPGSNPKLGMFGDDPDGVLEYPSAKDEADKEEKMEECSKGDGQSKAAPASKSSPSVRHEWYQTGQSVTLTFFAKGVDKDTAKIDIQPSSLDISFPTGNSSGTEFAYSFDPLFGPVDVSKSSFRITPLKVEISLAKAVPGHKWAALQGDDRTAAATTVSSFRTSVDNQVQALLAQEATSRPPVYPSSSRHGAKDWEAILNSSSKSKPKPKPESESKSKPESESGSTPSGKDTAATAAKDTTPPPTQPSKPIDTTIIESLDEYSDDDDAEANSSVDAFFRQLYAKADPDTQRAMMKSFVESNGTSLSTNWADVSKAKVDTRPPEGMVAKKWE